MKNSKKYGISRCLCALALVAAMMVSMAACGGSSDGGAPAKEWAWVPEYVTIEDENVSYYDMQMVGDGLYYVSYNWDEATQVSSQSICKYSLTDRNITSVPITWLEERPNQGLNRTAFAPDGGLYGIVNIYNDDYSESQSYLSKFGPDGKQQYEKDISDIVGGSYVDALAIDDQGRLYISIDTDIHLFDAEGNNRGSVSLGASGGWIRAMGCDKEGKMYVCYYNNGSYELAQIDFDGKRVAGTYANFPNGNSDRLVPGIEKDFLVHDGSKVYEYDIKSQSAQELFDWLDSDINGNNVQGFGVLEDGRILAINMDWENEENGIVLLTKKKASEVPQKENIVIACLGGYNIQSMAVKFNKSSDKYHISIKDYADYNSWDGNDYEAFMADVMNRLNNDITSNNCPDILDLSGVNVEQLAAKGVFEDLSGYLDKSEKLSQSDYLENVLKAYTFDDKLVSIPYSFQMVTVAGKGSDVGDKKGWTVEELIAYADAHPEAQLFDGVSKSYIMQYMMIYNKDAFINWATGECNFDSDTFKSILEFANRFPEEVEWSEDDLSTPNKIQRGEVLLYETNIYDFQEIQVTEEIFQGDASYIGYPTMDGSSGCMMAANQAYAITSKSKHKEGAWEFIESFLTQEPSNDRFGGFGFPTNRKQLEQQAEDAVKVEYLTDENGDVVKDENGDPIVEGGGSSFSYSDGWTYEYRTPTQEEVDLVKSLMEEAKVVSYAQGDEIMKIINEEAEAYYKGQKSVDEVAQVIQSRVKIYIGENN